MAVHHIDPRVEAAIRTLTDPSVGVALQTEVPRTDSVFHIVVAIPEEVVLQGPKNTREDSPELELVVVPDVPNLAPADLGHNHSNVKQMIGRYIQGGFEDHRPAAAYSEPRSRFLE